jgi:DHA2 family multidrug resistance protein-like MFS transporter
VLTQVGGSSELAVIVAGSLLFSLGLAPVFTMANDIIIGAAPPERAGAAAGISETSAELGGALGIAILGSIGTVVYRGALADAAPNRAPPEVWEAARSTLGGALAVSERLPDQLGASLLAAARSAFTLALELTAAICAVVVIATAVLTAVLLRRVGPGAEAEGRLTEDAREAGAERSA